jgi:hypothetical protein
VNAIAAGIIVTPATAPAFADPTMRGEFERSTAMRRLGRLEEVATAAVPRPEAAFADTTAAPDPSRSHR